MAKATTGSAATGSPRSWRLSGNAAQRHSGRTHHRRRPDGTAHVYRSRSPGCAPAPPTSGPPASGARARSRTRAWRTTSSTTRPASIFDSAPLTKPVRFQGPINARLYASSLGGDGMLSVAVEDVAPDGTVKRLTGGWQVISHRALDTSRSRATSTGS